MSKKRLILETVSDLASDFMYYDRKEDEELSTEDIENAIASNDVTIGEISELFIEEIKKRL